MDWGGPGSPKAAAPKLWISGISGSFWDLLLPSAFAMDWDRSSKRFSNRFLLKSRLFWDAGRENPRGSISAMEGGGNSSNPGGIRPRNGNDLELDGFILVSSLRCWLWHRTWHRSSIPNPILAFQALGADSHPFTPGFPLLQLRSFGADPARIRSTKPDRENSSFRDLRNTRNKGEASPPPYFSAIPKLHSPLPNCFLGYPNPGDTEHQHWDSTTRISMLGWFLGTIWDMTPADPYGSPFPVTEPMVSVQFQSLHIPIPTYL